MFVGFMNKFFLILFLFCLSAKGATGPPGLSKNIIYAQEGNDLTSIKNQAVAGTTIIVGPGTYYNCSNLLKSGVSWIGNNSKLVLLNVTNDPGWGIFDDRFSGATTSLITGFTLIHTNSRPLSSNDVWLYYSSTNVNGALCITNPNSRVIAKIDRIGVDYLGSGIGSTPAIYIRHGSNYVNVSEINDFRGTNLYTTVDIFTLADQTKTSSAAGLWATAGENFINISYINTFGYCFWGLDNVGGSSLQNIYLTGEHWFGKFYVSSEGSVSNVNWKIWANVKEVSGNLSCGFGGVGMLGVGKLYFVGEKVSTIRPGTAAFEFDDGADAWVTVQKTSATNRWLQIIRSATTKHNGKLIIDCAEYEDTGIDVGLELGGGNTFIRGGQLNVTNGIVGNIRIGATLNLDNAYLNNSTSVSNSSLNLFTNGSTFRFSTIIAPSTKFSISSLSTNQISAQYISISGGSSNIGFLAGSTVVTNSAIR